MAKEYPDWYDGRDDGKQVNGVESCKEFLEKEPLYPNKQEKLSAKLEELMKKGDDDNNDGK